MRPIVLDTDVFSFFFKKDTRAELYKPHMANRQLCLSFMTVAELKRWAEEKNWGEKRRDSLEQALRHYVVMPYDAEMADLWAKTMAERSKAGNPMSCGDAWIAATALRHGATLLTHNGKHFGGVAGLELVCGAG